MQDNNFILSLVDELHAQVHAVYSQVQPNQELYKSKSKIQDLCTSLLREVVGAQEYAVLIAQSCEESSALGFVTSVGVADIIHESADKIMTLESIAEHADIQSRYLSVVMNCVLGLGFFTEVEGLGSNIYANNEFSEVLREVSRTSVKSAVGFLTDEVAHASALLLDAASTHSDGRPGLSLAFGFHGSVFDWMSDPMHSWRSERMGKAMKQLHRMANENVIYDYDWSKLTSPVVDVGGGIGSLELALFGDERSRQRNAGLKFMITDIPKTVEDGKKAWQGHPAEKQVEFFGSDFLAAGRTGIPSGKGTYLIRHVLHDWSDTEVVQILKNVREAMSSLPSSRLLLCEMLLDEDSSRFVRVTSLRMLGLNNGRTRKQAEMFKLVEEAGFKVTHVCRMKAVDTILELEMEN